MTIAVLVEGQTEAAFKPILVGFLQRLLSRRMPKLRFVPYDGLLPRGEKLLRVVANLLAGSQAASAVIALTDVYTGTKDFLDADDAKSKMRKWVGEMPDFYPHVALHDFEAWLLPYWPEVQRLAGHNKACPSSSPESVNQIKPPARHLKELFEAGRTRQSYNKPRDALRILRDKDLTVAANACPELKSFLNRIISLAGGSPLP
jgi:hypothetical protein